MAALLRMALALQGEVIAALSPSPQTAGQIAAAIGATDQTETVYLLLEHLAANGRPAPRTTLISHFPLLNWLPCPEKELPITQNLWFPDTHWIQPV